MYRRIFFITVIFLIIISGVYSQNTSNVMKDYITDVYKVQWIVTCTKTVRFKKVSGFSDYKLQNHSFIIYSKYAELKFKSKKLLELYKRLKDKKIFRSLIIKSTIYGHKHEDITRDKPERISRYEGRVLITTYCSDEDCSDEEFVVFLAD